MSKINEVQRWWVRQGKPATLVLIVLSIIGALAVWTNPAVALVLGYVGSLTQPWTAITYPFAIGALNSSFGLISLVFLVMWLYSIGGVLERELGLQKFVIVWFVLTLVPAIILFPFHYPLVGSLLPVAGLTVIWASRYPNSPVMLMGLIPVLAKWIGFLSAGIVFFSYGQGGQFHIGLLACLSLVLAWAFATNKIPFFTYSNLYSKPKPTKEQLQRQQAFDEEVRKRKQDREERERLRKLFESSLDGDNKK